MELRISTGVQEGIDGSRTPVSDSSMKRCHTTGGGCIGIGARLDEIENDLTLAGWSQPGAPGTPITAA